MEQSLEGGSFRGKTHKPDAKSVIFEPEVEDQHLSEYFDEEPEFDEHKGREGEKVETNFHRKNIYNIEFKFFVFLRYLFIHFCFNAIGPLMVLLSPIFGYKNLKNMRFFDCTPFSRVQLIHYFCYSTFFILWLILPYQGVYEVNLYMIANCLIFRNIMIALKYAYSSETFLRKMKNENMSVKESYDEQSLPIWMDQTDEIVHKELQSAILSLDIESSLFFFEFLGKPVNPDSIKHLQKKYTYNDFLAYNGIVEQAKIVQGIPKSLTPEIIRKPRHREISSNSKVVLEDFKAFLVKKKFDNKKLSGYNLVYEIIKYGNSKRLPKFPPTVVVSLIRAFLPIIYRIVSGENLETPWLEYAILPIQTLLFMSNYLTILVAVGDLERRIYALSQIGNLISPRKVTTERKIYPTMNIFDPITLHTWENVRKVVDRYGKRFIVRNSIVITIMAVFYGVVLMMLLVAIFGFNERTKYDQVTLILLGYETLAYFLLLFRLLMGGAYVNDQYSVHKGILSDVRRIMTNLRRFESHIIGKYPIKLDNKIYIEGIRVLKEELGEEDFPKKLNERLNLLCETLDDMIKNLKYEETYHPYKVLGIPINYGILKSIIAGLISLVFAIVQSQIS